MKGLMSAIAEKDVRLLYAVNDGIKCRVLDIIMPVMTYFGSAGFSVGLPVVMVLYKKAGLKVIGFQIIIALSASHLIVEIIKRAVNRPRPWIALENVNSFGIKLYNYSFPSGHTTAAFSIAVTLLLNFSVLSFLAILIASIVGISRIYLGVHYPSDVLIGGIIGSAAAVITHVIMI